MRPVGLDIDRNSGSVWMKPTKMLKVAKVTYRANSSGSGLMISWSI